MMDFMELSKETTRLRKDAQYLTNRDRKRSTRVATLGVYYQKKRKKHNKITKSNRLTW